MSETKELTENKSTKLSLKKLITRMADEYTAALPSHMPPEKFLRIMQTHINTSAANIKGCTNSSILAASMAAAQDGLYLDGREAALVRFGDKAKYMPMYSGLLKKIRNSGELSSIMAEVVHEHDEFDVWIDENGKHVKHRPNFLSERGKVLCVFAAATTKEGAKYIEVMSFDEIEKVRKSSKSGNAGPWKNWWGEMARKTVIRRLSKILPMSTDIEIIIRHDDDMYDLAKADPEPAPSPQEGPARLRTLLDEPQGEPENEEQSEEG